MKHFISDRARYIADVCIFSKRIFVEALLSYFGSISSRRLEKYKSKWREGLFATAREYIWIKV